MKDYIGKIMNKASQKVVKPVATASSKAPKVVTGGDLRAKKSSK